ncbi:MAG: hypothetical protein WCT01_03285 [Candidatus Shapirobacteria bacterium]
MEINKLIEQVKKQKWPQGHFAIFGSALLGVLKLREVPNIDVIVDGLLWEKILETQSPDNEGFVRIGQIKVSDWWFAPTRKSLLTLISEAEIVEGLPFIKIEEVLNYKKGLIDDKNKKGVRLIEKWLKGKDGEQFRSNLELGS